MMAARRFVLCAALTVLLAASACGGGTNLTPTAQPTSSSTARPASTPSPTARSNLLFFLRGNDLWITSVDGTTVPPRAITTGAVHAGFSGLAEGSAGSVDLYYIVQLSDQRLAGDQYEADFALYRVAIEGGAPEELLRYTGRPLEPFITPNAAVSRDGKSVLYADNDGIALLDLASGTSKRLLTNSPPCGGPAGCFAYHHPRWSPNGRRALITKTLWEGAQDMIIDPFASPVREVYTKGGGSLTARWSPGGGKICMSQFTYSSSGAVMVYDVASGASTDSTLALAIPTPAAEGQLRIDARGCAWSGDGRLAVGYVVPDDIWNGRIALLDESYAVLAQSGPIANLSDVVGWLADGTGVYFNRVAQGGIAESADGPNLPGIYRPAGGVTDLLSAGDRIVAFVPTP